ncbi:MAG TPA: globin family protein [Nevskiaceae bacterium]|nr:globin family protein [Nevskiaceae bacterium]
MTPREIELVQTSFEKVVPIADAAANLFYGRLFEIDPSTRPLFKSNLDQQGRMLMQALTMVVRQLHTPERIVGAVQTLGRKHVGYGVETRHYDSVGAALLWTLETGLGPAFTPEVKAAWAAAYGVLAKLMLDAANEVPAAA